MNTGKVKFYNKTKAFGFIIDNESGEEIFMHITGLKNRDYVPDQDDEVEYELLNGKKGLNATKVEKI